MEKVLTIENLCHELYEWSVRTFGNDLQRGPKGALKHLKQEAEEALEKPYDILEYADCLLLIIDAARRAGFSWDELLTASFTKMSINRMRKYPSIKSQDIEGAIQHER